MSVVRPQEREQNTMHVDAVRNNTWLSGAAIAAQINAPLWSSKSLQALPDAPREGSDSLLSGLFSSKTWAISSRRRTRSACRSRVAAAISMVMLTTVASL